MLKTIKKSYETAIEKLKGQHEAELQWKNTLIRKFKIELEVLISDTNKLLVQ